MVPQETIRSTRLGSIDAYLVEARSQGGLSGSPVFIRPTRTVGIEKIFEITGYGDLRFLGLVHGHWDIHPNDFPMDDVRVVDSSVNMGIAIVVPARKILEILHIPEILFIRKTLEDKYLREHPAAAP
jgi:hypothetical protein